MSHRSGAALPEGIAPGGGGEGDSPQEVCILGERGGFTASAQGRKRRQIMRDFAVDGTAVLMRIDAPGTREALNQVQATAGQIGVPISQGRFRRPGVRQRHRLSGAHDPRLPAGSLVEDIDANSVVERLDQDNDLTAGGAGAGVADGVREELAENELNEVRDVGMLGAETFVHMSPRLFDLFRETIKNGHVVSQRLDNRAHNGASSQRTRSQRIARIRTPGAARDAMLVRPTLILPGVRSIVNMFHWNMFGNWAIGGRR